MSLGSLYLLVPLSLCPSVSLSLSSSRRYLLPIPISAAFYLGFGGVSVGPLSRQQDKLGGEGAVMSPFLGYSTLNMRGYKLIKAVDG